MRSTILKVLAVATVAVILTGCSKTSDNAEGVIATPAKPEPVIIPAIVPGSITSVVQKDLAPNCQKSVDPVRAIMAKYQSGFAMSPAQTNEVIKLNKAVLAACTFPVYKKWYEEEFTGWLYAKN